MSHKAAGTTVATALSLDVALALIFSRVEHISLLDSVYWALATATTVGYGDVTPHTTAGKVVAMVVMLTVIPLFAATFSFFTTALTATHVRRSTAEIKQHVSETTPGARRT